MEVKKGYGESRIEFPSVAELEGGSVVFFAVLRVLE